MPTMQMIVGSDSLPWGAALMKAVASMWRAGMTGQFDLAPGVGSITSIR